MKWNEKRKPQPPAEIRQAWRETLAGGCKHQGVNETIWDNQEGLEAFNAAFTLHTRRMPLIYVTRNSDGVPGHMHCRNIGIGEFYWNFTALKPENIGRAREVGLIPGKEKV